MMASTTATATDSAASAPMPSRAWLTLAATVASSAFTVTEKSLLVAWALIVCPSGGLVPTVVRCGFARLVWPLGDHHARSDQRFGQAVEDSRG